MIIISFPENIQRKNKAMVSLKLEVNNEYFKSAFVFLTDFIFTPYYMDVVVI